MENAQYEEVIAMLAVIYKKLITLELKINSNGMRMSSNQSYINELRKEAMKISVK